MLRHAQDLSLHNTNVNSNVLSPCLGLFLSLAYAIITMSRTLHISITPGAIVALHSLNRPNCHYFC